MPKKTDRKTFEPLTLSTTRLKLRQWEERDKQPFSSLNADARVMEYFPAVLSQEQSDAMADRIRLLIAECGWGFWAVETIETGQFIGFVGLHAPALELPFCPCVEIGWRLAVEHWGKGYATEAAKAALRFGFEALDVDEIVSFTSVKNTRSQAVMQRLGMRKEECEFEHPDVPFGSGLSRHCLYKLSKDDWRDHGT